MTLRIAIALVTSCLFFGCKSKSSQSEDGQSTTVADAPELGAVAAGGVDSGEPTERTEPSEPAEPAPSISEPLSDTPPPFSLTRAEIHRDGEAGLWLGMHGPKPADPDVKLFVLARCVGPTGEIYVDMDAAAVRVLTRDGKDYGAGVRIDVEGVVPPSACDLTLRLRDSDDTTWHLGEGCWRGNAAYDYPVEIPLEACESPVAPDPTDVETVVSENADAPEIEAAWVYTKRGSSPFVLFFRVNEPVSLHEPSHLGMSAECFPEGEYYTKGIGLEFPFVLSPGDVLPWRIVGRRPAEGSECRILTKRKDESIGEWCQRGDVMLRGRCRAERVQAAPENVRVKSHGLRVEDHRYGSRLVLPVEIEVERLIEGPAPLSIHMTCPNGRIVYDDVGSPEFSHLRPGERAYFRLFTRKWPAVGPLTCDAQVRAGANVVATQCIRTGGATDGPCA